MGEVRRRGPASTRGTAAGRLFGKEVASNMTKSAVGDIPIIGDLVAQAGGHVGAVTGAAIGAAVAGAALNVPQPIANFMCKSRSLSPCSPRRGGRPLSNPVSPRANITPTAPVKPTRVDSPLQQNVD